MPHLFVDISSHGFGHLAQTAPVLNELRRRLPGLRLTLRSGIAREVLAQRISGTFQHLHSASDFGMRMVDALQVRMEDSAQDYAQFHRDWKNKVAEEARQLALFAPDLVLSNVSYLTLAAAQQAAIPALAMCSLNWADIYWHYCSARTEASGIHAQMLDAYNSAQYFLKLQPGMPMDALRNTREIGAVARLGDNHRAEIDAALGLAPDDKLVLIALGGIETPLPVDRWPRIPGMRWLVPATWDAHHPDVFSLDKFDLAFTDVVRSCDAWITKPGYGSFAEAAVNGTPVLYVRRPDWPEEPYLVQWLEAHGRCLPVERPQLDQGEIGELLQMLFAMPQPLPVTPSGITEAADILEKYLL